MVHSKVSNHVMQQRQHNTHLISITALMRYYSKFTAYRKHSTV